MSTMPDNAPVVLHREGSPVHAWVHGPPSASLVVLVHGAGMDHHLFDHQIPPLLKAGYRTAAVDLRGHGASQPIGVSSFGIDDLAEDLLALANELGAHQFAVVGHSVGGFVAQELVLRHPERISALIAVGSACITAPLSRTERVLKWITVRLFGLVPFKWIARLAARTTAVSEEAQRYAYSAVTTAGRTSFLTIWRAISKAIQPVPDYSVPQPLLLVRGGHDSTGNVKKSVDRWHHRDPHSQLVVLEDAGHNANQDDPKGFNQHVLAFLTHHVPPRP